MKTSHFRLSNHRNVRSMHMKYHDKKRKITLNPVRRPSADPSPAAQPRPCPTQVRECREGRGPASEWGQSLTGRLRRQLSTQGGAPAALLPACLGQGSQDLGGRWSCLHKPSPVSRYVEVSSSLHLVITSGSRVRLLGKRLGCKC